MRLPLGFGFALLLTTARAASAQAHRADICSMFSAEQVGKLLGTPVASGEPLTAQTGCQWWGKDDKSSVVASVVDTAYLIDPRGAPGYQVIPGLGKRAYSYVETQNLVDPGHAFTAAALARRGVVVTFRAPSATREGAVALLRSLVNRL
jgi:hypothetical protein